MKWLCVSGWPLRYVSFTQQRGWPQLQQLLISWEIYILKQAHRYNSLLERGEGGCWERDEKIEPQKDVLSFVLYFLACLAAGDKWISQEKLGSSHTLHLTPLSYVATSLSAVGIVFHVIFICEPLQLLISERERESHLPQQEGGWDIFQTFAFGLSNTSTNFVSKQTVLIALTLKLEARSPPIHPPWPASPLQFPTTPIHQLSRHTPFVAVGVQNTKTGKAHLPFISNFCSFTQNNMQNCKFT